MEVGGVLGVGRGARQEYRPDHQGRKITCSRGVLR
jgi:hypothetical protein